MIYGIGTDLCDIRRIRDTLARRGERFAEKVLGPHELAVFRERRARVDARGDAYLATRFAAKEAFSKAIGLGMRMPMTWRAMEVVKAPSGKPEIALELAALLARRLYYTTSYLVDLQQQAAGRREDLDVVDKILAQLVQSPDDVRKKKK